MFVEAESADEVRAGLAAMRFKGNGGTRPDAVGSAPAYWGMSEQEYKRKADLWPLNPDGELINWTIVESKQGLAHVREIAAVKGIGVLWPGAGTLRQVFSSTNAAGERVLDQAGWENAIQQVPGRVQGIQGPLRLSREPQRHRNTDETGLQRVRHGLGRCRFQRRGHRAQGRRPLVPELQVPPGSTGNPSTPSNVSTHIGVEPGGDMSLFNKLFGKSEPPKTRVSVCVECGMPIAEHKDWCSILRGQREMQLAAAAKTPQQAS